MKKSVLFVFLISLASTTAYSGSALKRNIAFEGTEMTAEVTTTTAESADAKLKRLQDEFGIKSQALRVRQKNEWIGFWATYSKLSEGDRNQEQLELSQRHRDESYALRQENSSVLCREIGIHCPKTAEVSREVMLIKHRDH